ncbi:two-component system cell cycle sensor histidine kinase/response regulator CckA [Sphingomonas kyeonggiensis]|uniref:hybrid sensor histidine kinase/response regulator n=1 Tax=Sphingomonas kyeonggiensis TaxID=1268553 RepID=UPI002785ECA3|nr:response regulator [Sphingomonas kyeonggiensis]MDQ0250882.1 two-component system cell cycle sensor histidine kinase/response regulator CckA [Sphingomonas kyeonggiensis]
MATLPVHTPVSPSRRWLPFAAAVLAGIFAGAVILLTLNDRAVAVGFVAAGVLVAGALWGARKLFHADAAAEQPIDWSVAQALAAASDDALAVTDRAGRLVCANSRFEALFAGWPTPPNLPVSDAAVAALGTAARTAWRDGEAREDGIQVFGAPVSARVQRVGEESLVWRFIGVQALDLASQTQALIDGHTGDRLGSSGIMAAMVSPEGRVRAANRVFRLRAMGSGEAAVEGRDFARFLITDSMGLVRFEREGLQGNPLRVLQIPFLDGEEAPLLVALLDEEVGNAPTPAIGASAGAHVRSLIALLPLGLALVDRDGRFVSMNDAFVRATRVNAAAPPLYPGDLVVREDKAALADAVRRFAGGAPQSAEMTVRMSDAPDEPVSIGIAGARGLGDAAVLISLKDSGEESKLKRQVAQATKMQAVGQLAGGVAHDFNNILTAIIGHCDLMLMRHSPGDSDYDDIQQIRANSNRAASLTRQLLAFSRQQTLRPQLLQLPDVISEVSNLLKRLLGETVRLEVKHGRNLGPVRADPGQLEQVVVNLAVNARDAMLSKNPSGGGTLTIETMAVPASEVRRMDDDVLPVGDYTALRIADNGTGIPPEILAKIWEPFFTTKEVGKGTGLGLSTVYGIIKQSGGFIFADNAPAGGAEFTIYLPVHAATEAPVPAKLPGVKEKPVDTWGTGTILVVEDEDMVRAIAERALTRQGYTVVTADNGEAALELIETIERPDLLISDVVMPVMDGPSMARRIRAKYPDLPILFMSGYAEEQLRKSIDLEQVSFLPKPFSVQQLAEAAREVLAPK